MQVRVATHIVKSVPDATLAIRQYLIRKFSLNIKLMNNSFKNTKKKRQLPQKMIGWTFAIAYQGKACLMHVFAEISKFQKSNTSPRYATNRLACVWLCCVYCRKVTHFTLALWSLHVNCLVWRLPGAYLPRHPRIQTPTCERSQSSLIPDVFT